MLRQSRLSRHLVAGFVLLAVALAAPVLAAAKEPVGAGLRHWAFGWDPGWTGSGLTARYRLSPAWDLSVAAGPDDYRTDSDTIGWDTNMSARDSTASASGRSHEEGWVRLGAGRKFWEQDRVSVSGFLGVTYSWTVQASTSRSFVDNNGASSDYRNRRYGDNIDTWTLALGIRPTVRISSRLQAEFDAGLAYMYSTDRNFDDEWYDIRADRRHEEGTEIARTFRSVGSLDYSRLKLIFWF